MLLLPGLVAAVEAAASTAETAEEPHLGTGLPFKGVYTGYPCRYFCLCGFLGPYSSSQRRLAQAVQNVSGLLASTPHRKQSRGLRLKVCSVQSLHIRSLGLESPTVWRSGSRRLGNPTYMLNHRCASEP